MKNYYIPCSVCNWYGKIQLTIWKWAKRRYARRLQKFEQGIAWITRPKALVPHIDICKNCHWYGILKSQAFPEINKEFPNVAIIGWGIGWVALALACLHRWIPYTLYERDESFNSRSQWYGLTLQQASKAVAWLWIFDLKDGIISILHKVHDSSWKLIWEWWRRKLTEEERNKNTKPRNIHISRQSLRKELLNGLVDEREIKWGHQLISISPNHESQFDLEFQVGNTTKIAKADLVVGADGIRSQVRSLQLENNTTPLRYLGCIVILWICPIESLWNIELDLLDGETVFQTVNAHERIYVMPYDKDSIMWQLSFPMNETEAIKLSKKWSNTLKQEWIRRLSDWHSPIPEILEATKTSLISGYPVYDREILGPEFLQNLWNITLIWDAMHPMSPFKGQGANQAILDALDLARAIATKCGSKTKWRQLWLRKILLTDFEKKMLDRTTPKVHDSALAVKLLHSQAVLHDWDQPRGRGIWWE